MEAFTRYLAVAGGGAVGAMLRYFLGSSSLGKIAAPFPTATFAINLTGSFIIGFFLTLITERIPVNPHIRLAIAVGFVGAYTTFSTFEYETARLIEDKDFMLAFVYIALSVVIGFAAVTGGIITARQWVGALITPQAAFATREARRNAVPKIDPRDDSPPTMANSSNGDD